MWGSATAILATRGIAVEKASVTATSERAIGLGQLLAKRPTKDDLEKKQIFFDEKRTMDH